MKISTKGRYGLTIMIELAKKHGEGPTSLKLIAQTNDLSEHYLEQLIAPLILLTKPAFLKGAINCSK